MTTSDDHNRDQTADHAPGDSSTDPSDGAGGRGDGFDLARLGEITGRDGFAVFDPTSPGGVRALTPAEQHALGDSIRSSRVEAAPEVERAVAAEFGATPDEVYTPSGHARPGPDHQVVSSRTADHWYAQALDDADTEGVEPEETQAWEQHLSHLAGATAPPRASHTVHTDAGPLDVGWVADAGTDALEERSRELEQRWLYEPQAREDDLLLAEWDVVDDEIERRETPDRTPPDPSRANAAESEAYLDSRPGPELPYRADAEWGDPDYREPASDAEAAARTDYVREHFPATGWSPRANTEIEDALDDAAEQAVLSDRAHDLDPQAWAEYHRLLALDQLAPLPTDRDALDAPPDGERGQGDYSDDPTPSQNDWHHEDRVLRDHLADEAAQSGGSEHDGPFTDTQGRWWASTGAWAAGTCDPAKATDATHPDDPERLRRRLEDLRAELATRDDAPPDMEDEQRREQLARWHDDDAAGGGLDTYREASEDGGDRAGWGP